MRIIPKKTKHHLSFRNKINSHKILVNQNRQNHPIRLSNRMGNNGLHQAQAWLPPYEAKPSCGLWGGGPFGAEALIEGLTLAEAEPVTGRFEIHTNNNPSNQFALFGRYAVVSKSHGKLSSKYIETVRLHMAKALKKKRLWLRLCCDTPVTARPIETRMGKGKGSVHYWEARIRPGQVLFEFSGLDKTKAKQALHHLRKKSSYGLKVIDKLY